MHRLVEDLLELSTIESGQVALELAPTDLAALVGRAADRAERWAAARGVALAWRFEASPIVPADARRLERVLDNLLGNAVKHTPAGGRITLSVAGGSARRRRGSPPDTWATVSVHNTGSAIAPDELERIFERFYQIDKARTGSGDRQGHGLGLSIAREIVQAHGGRIVARSSPEDGTELVITLPALDLGAGSGLGSDPGGTGEATAGHLVAS